MISHVGKLLLALDEATLDRVAQSLERIFVGDASFRGDGLRRIWHRGESATDVVSWVDRDGQIMRQEFTFGGLVVRWERDRGVVSGAEQGSGEHSMPATRTVDEWGSNTELFNVAFEVLRRVQNSDFYLRHLLGRLADHTGQDRPSERNLDTGEVTMTHILHRRLSDQRWEDAEDERAESHTLLWVTVATLGLALFVGGLWYVLNY